MARRRRSPQATPRGVTPAFPRAQTRRTASGGRGLGCWAGRDAAPLDRSEKIVRFLFPRVESPSRERRSAPGPAGLSLERWVRTRSFGREQGKGLGLGRQLARDLVLGC